MPEHVHLLIGEPERGKLSLVIQMLKQMSSRRLKPPGQPRFWQIRYYDFPAWSEAKRVEKLRYREGHDFSRADRGQEQIGALAPEVLVYANAEAAHPARGSNARRLEMEQLRALRDRS
jgi:hypothetical protein